MANVVSRDAEGEAVLAVVDQVIRVRDGWLCNGVSDDSLAEKRPDKRRGRFALAGHAR